MNCTKCHYINDRDQPYRPDVWEELSTREIDDLNDLIDSMEHDEDCPNQ